MRKSIFGLSALALVAAASPAFAQEEPASDFTITGSATVVSDYRFRGISQTDEKAAVQGSIGVSHSSGLYVGTWGSSVDDALFGGADQEIDIYGGYTNKFGAATVDVGLLYYYYPGAGFDSDYFEPYASISGDIGPVNAKVGVAYAFDQKALPDDNLYVYTDLAAAIPTTPFTLKAHVGYTDSAFVGANYWDWSVGATASWKNLTFGVSYVDTNYKRSETGLFYDSVDATVVGSIGVAF